MVGTTGEGTGGGAWRNAEPDSRPAWADGGRRPGWGSVYRRFCVKPARKVCRERGLELHPFISPGVEEAELPRMQQLPLRFAPKPETRNRKLLFSCPPIHLVADDRVAHRRQVNPDLMCSPGLGMDL